MFDNSSETVLTESSFMFGNARRALHRPAKKQKTKHLSPDIIVVMVDRNGNKVPVRGLLDTGTSATIALRHFVAPGKAGGYKGHPQTWSTLGGKFVTKRKARLDLQFAEFSRSKTVHATVHVDDTTNKDHALYDIIIGMDLMVELGIDISTSTQEVVWGDHRIPLRERGELTSRAKLDEEYYFTRGSCAG